MTKYLKFPSKTMMAYQKIGEQKDKLLRDIVSEAVGIKKKRVQFKKHTLISGPPGVGKSYSTVDLLKQNKVKYITVNAGMSDIALATLFAYNVFKLSKKDELIVVIDDADDVIFKDYASLNKWKIAFGNYNPDIGEFPFFNHDKTITPIINAYRKNGKEEVAEAFEHFQEPGIVGLRIPMHQLRFIVLCNRNYKDKTSVAFKHKMQSAVDPVVDRFLCRDINLTKEEAWGWLAYVLANSQPFEKPVNGGVSFKMSDKQKTSVLDYMNDKWDRFHAHSFRTVGELAENIVNHPSDYRDKWEAMLV